MPHALTLAQIDVTGKTVLLRADLNVPVKDGPDGKVVDDATRLERLMPTIRNLTERKAKVVILSHFGRPEGKPDPFFTLKPVATALEKIAGTPVMFVPECIGPVPKAAIAVLPPGGIAVLENTRFHPGEEKNDPAFVRELMALGDIFVNDAFSAAHRAHASTTGLAEALPCAAGLLMQAELEALTKALEMPAKPVMAIVGGAKVSTKIDLLNNLVTKIDTLVLGGGMANTFLAARGANVGGSLYEHDQLLTAKKIMANAVQKNCTIVLPVDAVVAAEMKPDAPTKIVPTTVVPPGMKIFDIGPQSITAITTMLKRTKTLVWNGPMGVFEIPQFAKGTIEVAQAAAAQTQVKMLLSVAGGGDTVSALNAAKVTDKFSYVSTAGGAFLEWLEGKKLPGVAALERAAAKRR